MVFAAAKVSPARPTFGLKLRSAVNTRIFSPSPWTSTPLKSLNHANLQRNRNR